MNSLIKNPLSTMNLIRRLAVTQTSCFSLTSITRDSTSTGDFRPSEELAKERYESRADEAIEKKRARLLYQSRKRGMLENGVILATFADKYLNKFDADQLDEYDRLINLPTNDWDIFHWATKTKPTPEEFETKVMKQLRDHINNKVSKVVDEQEKDLQSSETTKQLSILDGRDPDEIVVQPANKKYKLDIDPRMVNLTHYDRELFDTRVKKYRNNQEAAHMTEWRKQFFLKRLRRTLSAPISLRNLSDKQEPVVFSQSAHTKELATREAKTCSIAIDSKKERTLKHHNFLQHLLGSSFTDDPLEYDDEAEAWSEMVWHREYGKADSKLAPSNKKCASCQAILHCCDSGIEGYLPKELFVLLEKESNRLTYSECQKCRFSNKYNVQLGFDANKELYERMCDQLREGNTAVICLLVDLTDFPGSIYKGLIDKIGHHHKIIVVGNKLDLLPQDGNYMIGRVTRSLKRNLSKLRESDSNLHIRDVMVMSARTGFGIEALVTRLLALSNSVRDIYLVGCANSGKSTLFSALLQTDLCAIRKNDIISRVTEYQPVWNDGLKMLKFPISQLEGWQLEMKKRRLVMVERDFKKAQRSLMNTTLIRQQNTPHMSMLIDRVELPQKLEENNTSSSCKSLQTTSEDVVKFEENHPMASIPSQYKPLSVNDNFEYDELVRFVHQTPSVNSRDQIYDLLTAKEKLEVYPNETITPRKYTLRPLQTIFIAGLGRLDLLTSTSSIIVTIFASKYLPIHVIPTRKADQFYCTLLGTPYLGPPYIGMNQGDPKRQKLDDLPKLESSIDDILISSKPKNFEIDARDGSVDVVLSSVGWALINVGADQDCLVRAYTLEGRGIYVRDPPMLPYGRSISNMGKKIRDTPLYNHPSYTIKSMSA